MISTQITKRDFADLYSELSTYLGDRADRNIMFVGAHPHTGTSLIATYFALVAAAQEQGPVLLADLCGPQNVQLHRFLKHHGDVDDNSTTAVFNRLLKHDGKVDGHSVDADLLPKQGPWIQHVGNGGERVPTFGWRWFERFNLAVSSSHGSDNHPMLDVPAQQAFWRQLHQTFKLIIVDCPPRSAGVECMALAPHMDATVLVISAEDTRVPVAVHLRDELIDSGAHLAGVVFNKRRFYIPEFIYSRLGS